MSGDEALYDRRVAELAERARFVVATAMFMGEHTLSAHVVVPGTSYLERDGTVVNLEGRPQRQRRAVEPRFADELEFYALVGERLGLAVSPRPEEPLPAERASLPPRGAPGVVPEAAPVETANGAGRGLELLTYRALFSGPGVERVDPLAFQRPAPEVEVSAADALIRGLSSGDAVTISSNGTSVELRARINRRLRAGVVRVAGEHAEGLDRRVEVKKA
jgi:predicted molibdopterin-dependent oxidoreductase YjgC